MQVPFICIKCLTFLDARSSELFSKWDIQRSFTDFFIQMTTQLWFNILLLGHIRGQYTQQSCKEHFYMFYKTTAKDLVYILFMVLFMEIPLMDSSCRHEEVWFSWCMPVLPVRRPFDESFILVSLYLYCWEAENQILCSVKETPFSRASLSYWILSPSIYLAEVRNPRQYSRIFCPCGNYPSWRFFVWNLSLYLSPSYLSLALISCLDCSDSITGLP